MTVAVVDYGMGNLRSVSKAIEHVARGEDVLVTSDPADVARADRVVVPGQGAMPDCMRQLAACGLREAVIRAAAEKPFLGICDRVCPIRIGNNANLKTHIRRLADSFYQNGII